MSWAEHSVVIPAALNRSGRMQALALVLFDQGFEAHQLPEKLRQLLHYAAACYCAVLEKSSDTPERDGRDAVLAGLFPDLTPVQQAIVACAVVFQREKLRTHRETAFLRLDQKQQERALRLAAILQLAGALATRNVTGLLLQPGADSSMLLLDGEQLEAELEGIAEYGELWRDTIGELSISPADQPGPGVVPFQPSATQTLALVLPEQNGRLHGEEPVSEGARRVLRRFFERMLAREDDVRKDEDPEDVHQMRVATRRLRASLEVVEGVYDPRLIRKYRRGLRRVARALGAVRDGDVFLGALADHREQLSQERQVQLEPLVTVVTAERVQKREQLLEELERGRYRSFKHDFSVFLTTPGAGVLPLPETGSPLRVRDCAGSVLWRRYEEWRAFEVVLPDASDEQLHYARIAGKYLRYTLEFFAEALGPRVDELLEPLAALQENLGALQDGVTARAHIEALGMLGDAGAQGYLAALLDRREEHLHALPRHWEKVASAGYRRKLFELISKL